MAKIVDTEMQVFVTYGIKPIPTAFEDSLNRHLLSEVWGDSNYADEDIRTVKDVVDGKSMITQVRYQFGERYDEDLAEEIGELIEEQISRWANKTAVWEVLEG